MQNFLPLSEIQKQFTFSPIKTYRLFAQLRKKGDLKPEVDWIHRGKDLFVDMPRFIVEIQASGYGNFLKDETTRNQTTSLDNERNQTEIVAEDQHQENQQIEPEEIEEVKTNEVIRNQVKSSENNTEEVSPAQQILESKNEVIETLRKEADHLREANSHLLEQNRELTQMTHLLVAPKETTQEGGEKKPVELSSFNGATT